MLTEVLSGNVSVKEDLCVDRRLDEDDIKAGVGACTGLN
jgi:hypothetical protein